MLDVNQDYGAATPWLPGTKIEGSHVTFCAAPSFSGSAYNAKALSRLLFERGANRSARMIHQKLMANRTRLPMIWPPHREPAEWTFRATPLQPSNNRRRWLLLHIHGANAPLPFSDFDLITEHTSQEKATDLKPVVAKTGAPLATENKSLPLVGSRKGARRTIQSSFPALAFVDTAVDMLSVTRRPVVKEAQVVSGVAIVLPDPELQVEAASMTTLGPEDKRVVDVRPRSPEKDAEDAETLFCRSRSAFQAVNDYLKAQPNPHGHTWAGRIITSDSEDCFVQGHRRKRRFLVLEVQIAGLCTYVIDAHREPDDPEFALAMVRRVDAGELGSEHLHVWLRGFPFAGGEPWGGIADVPRWLLKPMHVHHQTTQLPASLDALPEKERGEQAEMHYIRLFRNRLIRHITQYEELQLKNSKRVKRLEHRHKII
ncbi:hypothetical protein [Xanthomonas sp. NCPPB 1062]|uniref:hypothetical protein n=1 Tax=Xanthomonas sp. NCPPB 1062 TaxID=487523 RepID=UPI00355640A4